MEAFDLEFEEIDDRLGGNWTGTLWGCAFEDFLTRRRAGPQRQQDRLGLRGALGKDQDDAALAQRLDRRGEHLVVLPRIVPGLDAPVDRHAAEGDATQDRSAGDERAGPWRAP